MKKMNAETTDNKTFTAKENFKAALSRKPIQWLPNKNDYIAFSPRILPENAARLLVNEEVTIGAGEQRSGKDMFGVEWTYVPEAMGATVKPGDPFLKDIFEWKEKIVWPDIETWDWEASVKNNQHFFKEHSDKFICITILSSFFERLVSFLDFENACIALILEEEKEEVHALFERLCELYEAIILKLKLSYSPDMIELHDDWGSQRSPFFSLETCREMITPYLKRMVDFCHKHGMYFQLHSCGSNEALIPAMIEAGVDLWVPQFDANNLYEIRQKYGDRLTVAARKMLIPDMAVENVFETMDEFFENIHTSLKEKPILFLDAFPSKETEAYFHNKFYSCCQMD